MAKKTRPHVKKEKVAKARPTDAVRAGISEVGYSGLNFRTGIIKEDFLQDLNGKQGRKVFKEMSLNDPVVGAILFAATMLIRQASWGVKPATNNAEDQKWADFVNSCRDDMSMTWADVMSEVMTMLSYGWSALELVYKKRTGYIRDSGKSSKFNDGLYGWKKLPMRSQDSLDKWEMDDHGGVNAMLQRTVTGDMAKIPIQKLLLFRTTSQKNNPEGVSALRTSYRPWYFKKRIEEIEGIGVERDLAGLPVLTAPEDVDIWDETDPAAVQTKAVAERIVQSIRRDEQEGVLKPFGWELELLSTGGRRSLDTSAIISRYNTMIAMTVLADFIILGHNNRYGSFALASSKTHMFSAAVGGWLQAVRDVFNNYAIPRLFELNGVTLESYPKLDFGDVETPDLADLGNYISKLAGAGMVVFPNPDIERYLIKAGGMPWETAILGREPKPEVKPSAGAEDDPPAAESEDAA